jgi:hypothetical protein
VGPKHTDSDISPDDRRFLMVRQKGAAAELAPRMIVVENWMEEVKAKVPH